jgi:hypothetical protein
MITLKGININKSALVTLLFILLTITILFFWLKITNLFFVGYGVKTGLDIYLKFKQSWWGGLDYLRHLNYYPPLYPVGIAVTHFVLGPSKYSPYIFNSLLIFLLYLLSVKRFKGYKIFVFILLTTPGFYNFFKFPTMEYSLLLWVFFTLYFLISPNLWAKKNLICLGIFLGLGILIKWTYFAYVFGLFIGYFVYRGIKEKIDIKHFLIANILIIFSIILIAGAWYFCIFDFNYFLKSTHNDSSNLNYFGRFLFYIRNLKFISGVFYYWLFFMGTLFLSLRKKWDTLLLYSIPLFIGIGLLSLFSHLEIRYLLPFLVYISLLEAEVVINLKNKLMKRGVAVIFILVGVWNIWNGFLSIPTAGGFCKKISFQEILNPQADILKIISKTQQKLNLKNLTIATTPFNDSNDPNACAEGIAYRVTLLQAKRRHFGIRMIGFDSLEYRAFPYRIREIDFLIVSSNVIYGNEREFARWRNWIRKFNLPFQIQYQEICKDDPSYRELIQANFRLIQKFDSILGDDILLFIRNELIKNEQCENEVN